jgi:hypothetical protein
MELNPSKSTLIDEMKVEAVGTNKDALDFGAGGVETIVSDGTDRRASSGPPLSVRVEATGDSSPQPLFTVNSPLRRHSRSIRWPYRANAPTGGLVRCISWRHLAYSNTPLPC